MANRTIGRIAGDFFGYLLLFRSAPENQRPSTGALRNHLLGLLEAVTKDPEARGISAAEIDDIRFALIAWADEMIIGSDWSGVPEWQREPLALLLFSTVRAGNEFYEHLSQLPSDQIQAREIYFLCLTLGFEGECVDDPGHRSEVIHQNYEMLRASGRARDSAEQKRVAPPAYDYEITLPERRGTRIWSKLLWMAIVALGMYAALWFILKLAVDRIPVPPGGPI